MGACLSSTQPAIIEKTNGGEEDFYNLYLEDKLLGQGEFGQVKLVHNMKTHQVCAVKILRKGIVFKDNVVYSPLKPHVLRGEVNMLRTLGGKHHCLQLLGVYESNKNIYMVTELCAGGEMMEYVSQQEELRTIDVSRIVYQLLDAIHHCASHGVLHRDVKPENVMFCHKKMASSELRLIDFGSGCMDIEQRDVVVHSTFAGSAFYISPEMFQRTYTAKTDVWSCGVVLYVLVAGYPADELQKAFNILHKSSKKRNLKSLPNLPQNMPDSFYHLLEELLEYRHKGRKSAGELLQHEFVQFHKQQLHHDDDDASNLDIHQVMADSLAPTTTTTKSMRLTSSVQRHSMFMDFKKFERSVTTLLATLLSKQELNLLLQTLERRIKQEEEEEEEKEDIIKVSGHNNDNEDDDNVAKVSKKLNIIPICELETMLEEMKQTKWYVYMSVVVIIIVVIVIVVEIMIGLLIHITYYYCIVSTISITCQMLPTTRALPIMSNSWLNFNENMKYWELHRRDWNDVIRLVERRKPIVFMVVMSFKMQDEREPAVW
jgi:calcium-dependent protein kinase